MNVPHQAFVLGAGLGTRLRPLTGDLPKPLVPVAHVPLLEWCFHHLSTVGVTDFVVNTHHFPEEYHKHYPTGQWHQNPLRFRNEPILLETAGGIANVADLLTTESFWVYNGDILANLPLQKALEHHEASGNEITLVLRSSGPGLHIAWNENTGQMEDIRGMLGLRQGTHQFTGIYLVRQSFLQRLTPGKKESVIPIFLNMTREGTPPGCVVIDEGDWMDLGDRDSYLAAHRTIVSQPTHWPVYQPSHRLHPEANIHPEASIDDFSFVGPGCEIKEGAIIKESVLWHDCQVEPGTSLDHCVVRRNQSVSGHHKDTAL